MHFPTYPGLLAPRFNTEWTLVELIAVRARSSINGLDGVIRTHDLLLPKQADSARLSYTEFSGSGRGARTLQETWV